MTPINGINPSALQQLANLSPAGVGGLDSATKPDQSFKQLLIRSIDHVNTMQQDANVAVESLLTGGDVNPAEVLAAVQKADMTFRMMQQIRNKIVDAYQQLQEIRI